MQRFTITLGATTTSNGKVISASSAGSINGVKIALEHDQIFCPACKYAGYILTVGPRLSELWNGKEVALENDLCICGCSPHPRLIASQTLRCQVVSDDRPEPNPLQAERDGGSSKNVTSISLADGDEGYDIYFIVKNEAAQVLSE